MITLIKVIRSLHTLYLTLHCPQEIQEDKSGEKINPSKQVMRLSRGGRNLSPMLDPSEEGESDISDLEARIEAANMPEEAAKVVLLGGLESMLFFSTCVLLTLLTVVLE